MNALRVLFDDGLDARRNVALTAAMAELHAAKEIPDTLRIYRYPKSVLLGRSQSIGSAIDAAECRRRGAEIARRITGGGAIYMDAGVVTWDLVVFRKPGTDVSSFSRRICTSIAEGLGCFGVAARFRRENDIEIGGRKVSGASGYGDGPTLVYQGSLLVAPDFGAMEAVLKLNGIRKAVTSLAERSQSTPQIKEVMSNLSSSICATMEMRGVEDTLGAVEIERTATLFASEYGQDDFVFEGADRIAA